MAWDFDGNPISLEQRGMLIGQPGARVGNAYIGPVRIATDWLGTDLSHGRHAWPRIYETMIFPRRARDKNAPWNLMRWRYATRQEALAGHIAVVNRVRARGVQALICREDRNFRRIMRQVLAELGQKIARMADDG